MVHSPQMPSIPSHICLSGPNLMQVASLANFCSFFSLHACFYGRMRGQLFHEVIFQDLSSVQYDNN